MKPSYLFAIVVLLFTAAFPSAAGPQAPPANAGGRPQNPFFSPSTLPYQAPPFDKINDADYPPAIEEGMKRQLAEIEAIADNPRAADVREHDRGAGALGRRC